MPRFHFNLRTGAGLEPDEDGLVFGSLEAAYLDAWRAACLLWGEMLGKRQDPTVCCFEITDEEGQLLTELHFTEVLEAARGRSPAPPPQVLSRMVQGLTRTQMLTESIRSEIVLAREAIARSQAILAASRRQ